MRKPNWSFWKNMREMEPWQAIALTLNIDPNSLGENPHPISNNPYNWHDSPSSSLLLSTEINQKFEKMVRLLESHRINGPFSSNFNFRNKLYLTEFATWCLEIDQDIPDELKAMAKPKEQPVEAVEPTTEQNKQNNDNNWKVIARKIGIKIHEENPRLSIDQIAEKTHKQLLSWNITGRGGRVPTADTIKRHALTQIKS